MRLTQVRMPTNDLETAGRFYAETLGLPVVSDSRTAAVSIGSTSLVLEAGRTRRGAQHLAFTIPTGSFAAARQWLEGRVRLLGRDGVEEFPSPPSWNAMSVYFDGPDGQVLELIERRDLRQPYDGGFGPEHLLGVSEVGVAVPDVLATVAMLEGLGVHPYGNPPGAGFAAVGDIDGLLILVPPGRAWLPTDDRVVADDPVLVRVEPELEAELAPGRVLRAAASS